MGIDHPLDLTGVYEGIPIGRASVEIGHPARPHPPLPPRRSSPNGPRSGETFEHLVRHILIHEVGHHFGLSDEDMHALEDRQ